MSALVVVLGSLLLGACATPGPNHTYVVAHNPNAIVDLIEGEPAVSVPTYLRSPDRISGIAYDLFTDHLFLRVSPGNFIQVIDRPARKIKRTFTAAGLPPGPGDLAIRSRDRHLFFAHPTLPAVVETTLYGAHVRTIQLAQLSAPLAGLAYDQELDQLLVLARNEPAQVYTYTLSGERIGELTLDRNVARTSLAFDSVAREIVVRLHDEPAIGFFDRQGHLLRTLPTTSETTDFIDVGPRSFIRIF